MLASDRSPPPNQIGEIVIKSDGLPELRKSATGRTQVLSTYDDEAAALRRAAAESQLRALHPRSLGKSLADRIARTFGTAIDVTRLPERVRVAYARAVALDEIGATEEQRRVADAAYAEVVAMIAASRELNDLLMEGRPGDGLVTAAQVRRPAVYPQDAYD